MSIQPPPSREKLPVINGWAEMPRAWIKYFNELASQVGTAAGTAWANVSKSGSSLADIETRKHSDLQNLNTADHAHMRIADRDALIGGNDTILHYHSADRNLTGSASQTFSVADPTNAAHAVPADWVGYMPTVAPAASPNIFGASGATINYSGDAVTMTSIAACTAAQVGSMKRVIPAADANITASANLIVDDATSGTFVMPAGALLDVLATSTTTFKIFTVFASGTWIPSGFTGGGTGITYVGSFTKRGNKYSVNFAVIGTGLTTTAGATTLSGLPAPSTTASGGNIGSCMNSTTTAGGVIQAFNDSKIYFAVSLSSTSAIHGTVEYAIS